MTTPQDICISALKKAGILGVGQTALNEDINDAFTDLNDMLAQWNRKRWLIWHLVESSVTSTGQQAYTVGAGQQFNVTRPDRIEAAFLRQLVTTQPNQVDYQLEIIQSMEDYSRIQLKTLGTFPEYVFYDSAYPIGLLYPWPIPQPSTYSVHIIVKEHLASFTSLNQTISLPPEYIAALKWNLAPRLLVSYQLPVPSEIIGLAEDSLNLIRNANAQIPTLQVPYDLVKNGNYNIFSNQVY